jgi:hypothetical protein
MNRMVDVAAAALMIAATAGLLAAGVAMARRPGRWPAFFRERTWRRAIVLTLVAMAAAGLGSAAGGGSDVFALALVLGAPLIVLELALWSYARTFGSR